MSEQKKTINWFPGHMTGAFRKMKEDIKLCDMVIVLLDARIPESSNNPELDKLIGDRRKMYILNKADMADPAATQKWIEKFQSQGIKAITMDSRNRSRMQLVSKAAREVCADKIERDKARGIIAVRPIKSMITGIPNVGKSTFINSYAGKSMAKTGNKPGVTKGNQWIRIAKDMNLLDTPGVLWPKFEDMNTGYKIAFIGSINDNILDITDIAIHLIEYLKKFYCNVLTDRYKIEDGEPYEMLKQIADVKKALLKGGEPDLEKASKLLLEDLRSGRLGKITLEFPEE